MEKDIITSYCYYDFVVDIEKLRTIEHEHFYDGIIKYICKCLFIPYLIFFANTYSQSDRVAEIKEFN